jgi:hypothetical protein
VGGKEENVVEGQRLLDDPHFFTLAKRHYTRYCHPFGYTRVFLTMKKTFFFLAMMAFAAAASAQQYKWVDRDGKVRYGDVPPPGVKATPLKPPPAPPSGAVSAAKKGEKDKPLSPEAAFRKRQQEQQEQEQKAAKERAEAETKRVNCEQAQANLRTIDSGQRIARTNAAGERVFLEDDQIAKERERAQRAVSEWCK